jgi:hypothetical protein
MRGKTAYPTLPTTVRERIAPEIEHDNPAPTTLPNMPTTSQAFTPRDL